MREGVMKDEKRESKVSKADHRCLLREEIHTSKLITSTTPQRKMHNAGRRDTQVVRRTQELGWMIESGCTWCICLHTAENIEGGLFPTIQHILTSLLFYYPFLTSFLFLSCLSISTQYSQVTHTFILPLFPFRQLNAFQKTEKEHWFSNNFNTDLAWSSLSVVLVQYHDMYGKLILMMILLY